MRFQMLKSMLLIISKRFNFLYDLQLESDTSNTSRIAAQGIALFHYLASSNNDTKEVLAKFFPDKQNSGNSIQVSKAIKTEARLLARARLRPILRSLKPPTTQQQAIQQKTKLSIEKKSRELYGSMLCLCATSTLQESTELSSVVTNDF